MKYICFIVAILLTTLLCGLSYVKESDNSTYVEIIEPNETAARTIDGYRKKITQADKVEDIYYANKKSKKFHRPDCTYALRTSEANILLEKDRNKLITDGYQGCQFCNP